MTTAATQAIHLADALHKGSAWRKVAVVVAGSLLLWASAKVQVPFYPVPMTMQTFVVILLGVTLGWRLGGAAVLLYLAQGASGLPAFAGNPAVTGGYLVGFAMAAAATGALAQRRWDRSVAGTLGAFAVGLFLIYAPGLLWLGSIIGFNEALLAAGLTPFLLGEAFKMALAAAVLPLAWKAAGRA